MTPRILKSGTAEFKRCLDAIIARRGGHEGAGIEAAVTTIIADVLRRDERLSSQRMPIHNCEAIVGARDGDRETSSVQR
jgi:hypothetical protein